jgi:hypothetical protein
VSQPPREYSEQILSEQSYEHMDDMVICQDKAHMSMATTDGCLLFHDWPPRKRSPKPPAGPPAGHPAKNAGRGTSGARQPPKNNGNPRAGKPRQAGKGTQQQQPRQQLQSVITHQRAMERLNLQLEVARVNEGAKTVSVLGRLQPLERSKREVGVVPLHVVVPMAAGEDLRLRDNADVDIVVIQQV